METESRLRLADVFVSITDPQQAGKTRHDLVEILVVAVNGVLAGADNFVEIGAWANEKLAWFRPYFKLEYGIPSHDTFGRLFGLIDPGSVRVGFSALGHKVNATVLHLVSAFAARAGLVLGQTATAAKSNEKTAIPALLQVGAGGKPAQQELPDASVWFESRAWQRGVASGIGRDFYVTVNYEW